MARTETSRLVITLDVDRATQKLLGLGTTIDGVETKFNKAGQAAQRFGTTATKSGQQSAAAAVCTGSIKCINKYCYDLYVIYKLSFSRT